MLGWRSTGIVQSDEMGQLQELITQLQVVQATASWTPGNPRPEGRQLDQEIDRLDNAHQGLAQTVAGFVTDD